VSRHIPFGWNCSNGRDLTRNQEEEAAINQMMAWSKAGRTLGEIADELNSSNIPTKSGKKWLRGTVHHILKRVMKVAV
jgi:hypothetical protein